MANKNLNSSQINELQKIENDLAQIKKDDNQAKKQINDDLDALQKFMEELPEGVPGEVKGNLEKVFGTLSQAIEGDQEDFLNKVKDADSNLKHTLEE